MSESVRKVLLVMDETPRFAAFGYDMDNMKPRDWIEGEWPLPLIMDQGAREDLEAFIGHAVKGCGNGLEIIGSCR